MNKLILIFVILSVCHASKLWANDNERHQLQQQQKLDQLQKQEQLSEDTQIHYSPKNVSNTIIEDEYHLTQAIFMSVNQQDWQSVERYVKQYQLLPEYSEVIVNFAYGSLARAKRQYSLAEQYFRKMVQEDSEFVRGQLELARILFENQKNNEAKQILKKIYHQMPTDIQTIIDIYLQAIDQRYDWQGVVAVGMSYQTNVNQKSGKSKCYETFIFNGEEICTQLRTSMPAQRDSAWNFNANFSKPLIAREQHRLLFKGLAYGTIYDTDSNYSNQTGNIALGYSFKNAIQEWTILPFYESYWLHNQSLYNGYGISTEYNHQLSKKMNLNVQLDYQYNQFKLMQQKDNNGGIVNLYTTLTYQISPNTLLFSGANYINKSVKDKSNSFQQYGTRLGAYHIFNNHSILTALATYKKTYYDDHNIFIDLQTPKNKEHHYLLNYAMPNMKFKGFYPVLSYKYTKVDSNIDWFYAYNHHEFGIKVQKTF